MTDDQIRVANLIRDAFREITLEDGIGLLQGHGLDNGADSKTLKEYRSKDEKNDWSMIPVSDLNSCFSSLSFFDAEGMQFHLPAFLIADLEGTFDGDVLFHLTYFEHDAMSRFEILTDSQRNAVREFLLLRLSDPNSDIETPMIEKALSEYWAAAEES